MSPRYWKSVREEKEFGLNIEMRRSTMHKSEEAPPKKNLEIEVRASLFRIVSLSEFRSRLQLEVERAQSSRNKSEKKLMEMAVRVTNSGIVGGRNTRCNPNFEFLFSQKHIHSDSNVSSSPQIDHRDRVPSATTPRSASNEIRHTMFPFVNHLFQEVLSPFLDISSK